MTDIGEYSLIQCGWVCQRCMKFSVEKTPSHKGCLDKHKHIYYMGSQTLEVIPKNKIKKVRDAIAKAKEVGK